MFERLNKIREKNPNFDRKMIDNFAEIMPDLLNILIDGMLFDCHIGSKEVAKLAEKYITNNKDEHIGFHFDYDSIINIAKNYVNLEETEFYPTDLYVWANVKYGDMQHITTDSNLIIKYAISELTDGDYPFGAASERAYCWLKKHIENEEK